MEVKNSKLKFHTASIEFVCGYARTCRGQGSCQLLLCIWHVEKLQKAIRALQREGAEEKKETSTYHIIFVTGGAARLFCLSYFLEVRRLLYTSIAFSFKW